MPGSSSADSVLVELPPLALLQLLLLSRRDIFGGEKLPAADDRVDGPAISGDVVGLLLIAGDVLFGSGGTAAAAAAEVPRRRLRWRRSPEERCVDGGLLRYLRVRKTIAEINN